MPNPGLSAELMQEALDVFEKYDRNYSAGARAANLKRQTFENRVNRALMGGLKPRVTRTYAKPTTLGRLGRVHMVMPDIQAKPNVSHEHMRWIANYAIEKRPDVIVQIGDWADMPSLSLYDKGKRCYEGRRYVKDIEAANFSLHLFEETIAAYNREHPEDKYEPRKVITLGNHEFRIERATQLDASLDGKLRPDDLDFGKAGWEVYPFLEVVEIDGIEYSHYFISGSMGRPVSSAAALLKTRGRSATMGHVQRMDVAYHPQTQQIGMFCGTCYTHDEDYLGPQGNECPRQIIFKHEVQDGRYDLMAVSLRYLEKRYS
jgi:hypothetical protein